MVRCTTPYSARAGSAEVLVSIGDICDSTIFILSYDIVCIETQQP